MFEHVDSTPCTPGGLRTSPIRQSIHLALLTEGQPNLAGWGTLQEALQFSIFLERLAKYPNRQVEVLSVSAYKNVTALALRNAPTGRLGYFQFLRTAAWCDVVSPPRLRLKD